MASKPNTAAAQADLDDDFDFGADAEVIAPKVDLRRKAKERKPRAGDLDPVAAAEAAMAEMTHNFSAWMMNETDTLLSAWNSYTAAAFHDEERETLFRAAHDIKGQASTLGYPSIGAVAASLCRLLDLVRPIERIPHELVHQHVQAIRAIAHESVQNEPNKVAERLAARLATVTDDFIASLP